VLVVSRRKSIAKLVCRVIGHGEAEAILQFDFRISMLPTSRETARI
jgi:hypothetical protein